MIIKTGTDLSYAYYGDTSLTGQVTLSQLVKANDATDMRYMFAGCANIESVTAYEYEDSTYSYAYSYAYHGSYVDDNIRYAYIYNFGYTYTCKQVDKFEQVKSGFVKNMNHMFANCYNLTTVNLAYMNISNCLDMQGMFENCYNLKTVIFGRYACNDLLHTKDIFRGCDSLEHVYLPFELKNKVLNIDGQTGLHAYYYNADYNIEDTLPVIKLSYDFSQIHEIERYTTLRFNKIGAFIVEQDFDYGDTEKCDLNIYVNSNGYTSDSIFKYSTYAAKNNALELSDIADPFSYTLKHAYEFNVISQLTNSDGEPIGRTITYNINNSEGARYIDINTYLIYFSDNEEGELPGKTHFSYETTYDATKSRMIASTYKWFFGDIEKVKYLDSNTRTYKYSYDTRYDSYMWNTYDSYVSGLVLNNELDDDYDGTYTDVPVRVSHVYAYWIR